MGDTYHNKAPDVNFPDKEWGYLALEPTCFQFVGPDREPIDMSNTSQYLRAAEIIRESGLPNYRGALIPIKSGLKVPVWEKYLNILIDTRDNIVSIDYFCTSRVYRSSFLGSYLNIVHML